MPPTLRAGVDKNPDEVAAWVRGPRARHVVGHGCGPVRRVTGGGWGRTGTVADEPLPVLTVASMCAIRIRLCAAAVFGGLGTKPAADELDSDVAALRQRRWRLGAIADDLLSSDEYRRLTDEPARRTTVVVERPVRGRAPAATLRPRRPSARWSSRLKEERCLGGRDRCGLHRGPRQWSVAAQPRSRAADTRAWPLRPPVARGKNTTFSPSATR